MKATLEWDANFLKCNGIAVADVWPSRGPLEGWSARIYDSDASHWYHGEAEARGHIERRFKLTEQKA